MEGSSSGITSKDRMRIIRIIEEQNADPRVVAEIFDVHHELVREWLAEHREGRLAAPHPEGRLGRPAAMSKQQVRELYLMLREREPAEFGLGAPLWSRELVGLLIQWEFELQLSQPTITKILAGLGLHSPRNSSRALGGVTADVLMRAKAAEVGAKLLFGRVVRLDHGARFGGSEQDRMISAIDGRGRALFSVLSAEPDVERLVEFGEGLLFDSAKPIFVAMRCRSGHELTRLREFVKDTRGRFGLFLHHARDDGTTSIEFVFHKS